MIKTFDKMEGFSFVTPVTGLNRPNTGKEDDND
jgi:cold shock CspA family protein